MIDETQNTTTPPTTQAPPTRTDITAASMNRLTVPIAVEGNRQVTVTDMANMLENALHEDGEGKQLLFEQAQTLNAIFHRILQKGIGGTSYSGEYFPDHVSSSLIQLSLKAQQQCSTSIDILSKIKTREAFCEAGVTLPADTPIPENDETN